jgi:hypothetical protein
VATLKFKFKDLSDLSDEDLGLLLGVADQQVALMDALDQALERGDHVQALELARRLVLLERQAR